MFTTDVQAVPVSVPLDKLITLPSVYIPPHFSAQFKHIEDLLKQLLSLHILLCDFNDQTTL